MKISISMDDDLMKRIDEHADENYLSRSGTISIACNQYLNAAEASKAIKTMALAMRKIADTGTIDKESQEKLEDFERVVKMLSGI